MNKWFYVGKDGGKESNVTGYWLIECKPFFSIVLLKFDQGSREAFHTHAFNAISWMLSGECLEETIDSKKIKLLPSLLPIITKRSRFHKVIGITKTSWFLSFRGPWKRSWKEYLPETKENITLTNGRVRIDT